MRKFWQFTAFIILGFAGFYNVQADGIEFNIRFFDRQIYYVNTDPVYVQVTINNQSPNPFRFKLADERAFSIDFDIRTMTNRPLDQADVLIRKRSQNSQVFFREIAIESGESFSFREDIRDYINLAQPGSYRVKARIYPELYRTSSAYSIESNYLALNLRPAVIPGPGGIPQDIDITTGAVLVRQSIPPDEVVSYMIRARQASQWDRFFLYLDLEAMLTNNPVQRRRWLTVNEQERQQMVSEYRTNLQNSVVDGDISLIPTRFDIEQTVYTNNEGTVIVLARFRNPDFTQLRRYKYYLERKDNIWMIVNYTVEGMGTEAND